MALLFNNQFKFENTQISIYGTNEKPLFIGNEIASLLKYSRPRDAIHDHVWSENKISVQEYEAKNNCVLNIEQKKTYLINEPAVSDCFMYIHMPLFYSCCFAIVIFVSFAHSYLSYSHLQHHLIFYTYCNMLYVIVLLQYLPVTFAIYFIILPSLCIG